MNMAKRLAGSFAFPKEAPEGGNAISAVR